jgi:hypothetical protein
VLLAWALDAEGRTLHVDAIDPARRRARAPFRCMACGEILVARLGAARAHHFAHRPGSACPLTRPETALHLNAKQRLLALCEEAFTGLRRVLAGARCPGCRREVPLDLAAVGDAATPEAPLGALRCDVLLTRGGVPALAFEVRVTHALDAVKEEALGRAGVPALEIDARDGWEEERDGALVLRVARTLGVAPCPACATAARAEAGRGRGGEEAAVAELEAYRARGLMGPRPGPTLPASDPLGDEERRRIAEAFRCPDCGRRELSFGERLVRHGCDGEARRPVAWRGYDGALVELGWWKATRGG